MPSSVPEVGAVLAEILVYYPWMQLATGKVVEGKVLVDGLDLHEGQLVTVLTREPEGAVFVTPDEEAELLEAIAEAERGGTTSWQELQAHLAHLK